MADQKAAPTSDDLARKRKNIATGVLVVSLLALAGGLYYAVTVYVPASAEVMDWHREAAACRADPECDYGDFLKRRDAADPEGERTTATVGVFVFAGAPSAAALLAYGSRLGVINFPPQKPISKGGDKGAK